MTERRTTAQRQPNYLFEKIASVDKMACLFDAFLTNIIPDMHICAEQRKRGPMRAASTVVIATFIMGWTALAQQSDLLGSAMGASTNQTSGSTLERPITPSTLTPPEPLEMRRGLGGALPAVLRNPQPLQMINPLAPREYGDGTQYVSTNLLTGQAEGVTLLSIKLPSKPHKLKKSAPPKKAK